MTAERQHRIDALHREWCGGNCLVPQGHPCRIPVLIEATFERGAMWMREQAVAACHPGNDPDGEVAAAIRALTLE